MTLSRNPAAHNPAGPRAALSADSRSVFTASAVDPDWAVAEWSAFQDGCDIRFPGLGGHPDGILRSCSACRSAGRPKYLSPRGHAPQPTVLYDAGPGSALLYVEGVLKSFSAAVTAQRGQLPYSVAFINGSDGIGPRTASVVASQSAGRAVFVAFDADMWTNPHVAAAAVRVEGHIRRGGGASVRFLRVPRIADDATTGLDDFLSAVRPDDRTPWLRQLVTQSAPDLLDAATFRLHLRLLRERDRPAAGRRIAAKVCALGMPEAWVQEWRAVLKDRCRLPVGDFDSIRKDAESRHRDAARERSHEEIRRKGEQMPSPSEPLEVAHAMVPRLNDADGVPLVCVWQGDWYRFLGTHWALSPVTTVTDWLRRELRDAWYMSGGKEPGPVPWAPTTSKISEVVDAMASILRRPDESEPDRGIFTVNGRVQLDGTLQDHSADIFNITSLPYDYDPGAACPSWHAFLESSLPEAADREVLREMFGYLVSGDTDQQKIFFLSGPPGSGKGTTMRVLQGLLGRDTFTSTSLSKLGSHFGMESLIGKTVAFMPDVRFNTSGAVDAVEPLLSISGEDVVPVPRKNRTDWIGQLPARLVMASNDLPTLTDSAGALFRRLVVVRFGQSFAGQEDTGLTERLLKELPGILNWALSGYRSLVGRGRFTATVGGEELAQAARRESSPVAAFVDDCCESDPAAFTSSRDLYTAWNIYRISQGFTRFAPSQPGLIRAVCSAVSGLEAGRGREAGQRSRGVRGLKLTGRTHT